MRIVPAAIATARESEAATVCKVWEITRTDGEVIRFTEHDRDIEYDGETYSATASFDPSSIKSNADLAIGDMDVHGAFDTTRITAEDLLAGRYHGASFWVGELLWDDPDEGVDVLKFGWLGRVRESGGKFVAELLGPAARLQQTIGEIYSATCRATFGDSRCGYNLELARTTVTVTAVESRSVITVSGLSAPSADWWSVGVAQFLTGSNAGLSMDVRESDGTDIQLLLPMPFDIEVGDTLRMTAGCDHSLEMCRDRWGNVLNFRGEPHAPVSDDLIRGPGQDVARSSGGSAEDVSPDEPEYDEPTVYGNPQISDS